jgi:hypothetical protein
MAGLARAECPEGDLNRDCKVNLVDFGLLAENWLEVEPNLPLGSVIINEALAHSHAEASDWIELFNTTGVTLDISGWYLSDSDSPLTKYKIPNGTTIAPYGYIVFYENLHFGVGVNGFGLSESGETVYLSFGKNNKWAGLCDDRKFGGSETGVSLGLYTTSTDDVEFVAMDSNTPGGLNAYPKVGPIVISEIMYNHALYGTNGEYVELHNIKNYPVTLQVYDPCIGGNVAWQFTEGPDFIFPLGTTIPANGYLMVVKNPEDFNDSYGSMPPGVQVLGPFENDTKLGNSGENVEISTPGDLDPCDPNIRAYIRIDNVRYSDGSQHEDFPGLDPWPKGADGSGDGYSLIRKNPNLYGDDVANWKADEPTPGH